MMKRIALALVPLAMFVALPTQADAQRAVSIGLAGGPAFPAGDLSEHGETGFHLLGSLGFTLPLLPVGVRADLLWQQMPYGRDDTFNAIGGLLNATVPLGLPYVFGGIGVMRHDDAHGDHIDPGTETHFAFNVGAGVRLRLAGLGAFVEARYVDWHDGASVPVTVGITF